MESIKETQSNEPASTLKRHKKKRRKNHERRSSLTEAPKVSMSAQKLPSLLNLPPELRNIIYDYAFTGSILRLRTEIEKEYAANKSNHRSINLLLCCKQIHAEAIDVFYSNLTVETPFLAMFADYAKKLSTKHVQLVQQIKFLVLESECNLTRNTTRFDVGAAKKIFKGRLAGLLRQGVSVEPRQLSMEVQFSSGGKVLEYFHGGYKRYGERSGRSW